MIIMILELLAVSFILGLLITAVVLVGVWVADALLGTTRQSARSASERSGRELGVLRPRHRAVRSDQPRAA